MSPQFHFPLLKSPLQWTGFPQLWEMGEIMVGDTPTPAAKLPTGLICDKINLTEDARFWQGYCACPHAQFEPIRAWGRGVPLKSSRKGDNENKGTAHAHMRGPSLSAPGGTEHP